ncbi:TPA: hypothetical protein DCW54_01510, partial [Candidatus Dependentiae bacterium]|nr:hypothetical protein [Candidatus Dependentiae bacterium]
MKFHLYSLPLVLSMVTLQAFDYGPLKNQFIHDVIKIAPQLPGFNEGTGDAYNWLFQKIYQKKTVNLPVVPLIATLVSHTSPTKEVLIHAAASKNQTSVASTISRLKPFLKELHLNKKTYAQLLKSPFPLLRKNAKAIPFTELETAGEPFADDQLVDMLLALTQTIDEMKVPLEKSIKILCILEELLSHKDTPSSLQKVLSQVLEKDQTITGIELVYVAEMLLLPPNFMLQLAAPASKVIAQNFSEKINGDSLEEEIYNVIRFFGGNQEPAARIILAHPLLLRKKQDFEIPRLNKAIFDTEGKHLITTS